jgi:hypothetical protein
MPEIRVLVLSKEKVRLVPVPSTVVHGQVAAVYRMPVICPNPLEWPADTGEQAADFLEKVGAEKLA